MTDNSPNELSACRDGPSLLIHLLSRLMRRLPIYSGLTRLSFNWLTNHLFRQCRGDLEATLLNGTRMLVDPNDYHGRILYLFGTNDPKVHWVTQSLLRRGDRFLDIGANYSSIGLLAADAVGPTGHVHLFEPQPDLCQRVGEAIRCAEITNVTLHRLGLMDHDDELVLSRPRHHSGMATFVGRGDDDAWISQSLPVRDIATYVPPLIANYAFGVKLDVEGAEPSLMPWLVRQDNLRFIVFEVAHNQPELWNIVQSCGLHLYGLCRRVFRMQIQLISSPAEMSKFHDVVAVRLTSGAKAPGRVHPIRLRRLIAPAPA